MNQLMNDIKNELSIEDFYKDIHINIKNINRESINKYHHIDKNLDNPKFMYEVSRQDRMRTRLLEKLNNRNNPKK